MSDFVSEVPRPLPPRPNLEWLRKYAKDRLDALRASRPEAKLADAQLNVAHEFGFKSWRAMVEHIESLEVGGQIIHAARNGDAAELKRLISEHPNLLYVTGGEWDQPPLHHAARNGHLDCVEVLLAAGYDVNHRDKLDNATAVHFTTDNARVNVLKHLIDAGGDVQGDGDVHELGVLGWATAFDTVHRDSAELLLAHGAKLNIWSAIALDRPDDVRRILAAHPNELHRRSSRWEHLRTPLHFAVSRNLTRMVELLLKLGADANARDSRGDTPIEYARPDVEPDILRLLERAGGNKAEGKANRFGGVTPILNVKSVPASIAYFVERLGFRKLWDWGTPATFGAVGRDQVEIFLCQGAQGHAGTWLSMWVKDVDALYAEYQQTGAIIRQPPTNFPWGVREMNVEDLDGHRFRMGSGTSGPSDDVPLVD